MEIEKKYLVKELPENLEQYPHDRLTQGYIHRSPVIRVRCRQRQGEAAEYILTIKGRGLAVREELELNLTKEEYAGLLPKVEGLAIEKMRYYLPLSGGLTAELDVFEGDLAGLLLVEVEFASEAAMQAFTSPVWFGKEVTEDGRYHNSVLSQGRPAGI